MERAFVKNAADPKQVKRAERLQSARERRFALALRDVLSTPSGRLLFGDREQGIIARTGVYGSCWDSHGGNQSWKIGRQDFGHELRRVITEIDPAAFRVMERECLDRAYRDEADVDAAHTAPASEESGSSANDGRGESES